MSLLPQEQYCYVSLDYDASLADPAFQVKFSQVFHQIHPKHNHHTFQGKKLNRSSNSTLIQTFSKSNS